MTFGNPETFVPPQPSAQPSPKFGPPEPMAPGPKFGEPVDVFSDVELFKQWEAQQPELPIYERVKQVAGEMWDGFKGAADTAGRLAGAATSPVPGAKGRAAKEAVAFAAETAAEAYKGFALLGESVKMGVQTGLAKMNTVNAKVFSASAEAKDAFDDAAVRARMDFYRSARDLSKTSNDGRVIADNVINTVAAIASNDYGRLVTGGNDLTDTQISEAGARFVSNFIDPDMGAVVIKAGVRNLLTRAPAIGALRAAERDVARSLASKMEIESELLAARAAGDAAPALEKKFVEAGDKLAADNAYLKQQIALLDQQKAALDEALGKGVIQRGIGSSVDLLGRATEGLGRVAGAANRKIDDFIGRFGTGGGEHVAGDLARSTPGFGILRRTEDLLSGTGSAISTAGKYISAPESSLGYFQSLSRALPPNSVGRWAASKAERVEFLASTGRWLVDTAEDTTRAAGVGAAFGALNGDVVAGATQGAIFGMAGSQFGQFRKWNSAEEVFAQQQQDIAVARKRRENAPGDQQKLFDAAPEGLRLAAATFEQAYPDLNIKFVRQGGKGAAGWYDNVNGVGEVTVDLDHPTPVAGLLTHEVKHHLGRNPEIMQAVETKLLGDPNTGEAGIFTARDESGKPIVEEVVDAQNPEVTRKQFKLSPEFDSFREQYLQRLRDANLPTIEYERDPKLIAHEIWAESEAANLLGRQVNGKFDIIASGEMGRVQRMVADAVAGSQLVGNAPFLQRALAKFGVVFDGMSGKAANTGLFRKTVELKGLTQAVEKYNRLRADERAMTEGGDEAGTRSYTEAEILSSPALQEMFSSGHDVVRDPVTGKMRFVTEKEAGRRAKEFFETLTRELDAYTGNEPGVVKKTEQVDAQGRRSQIWRGTKVPEPVIKKMEESGRFNPTQLQTLRTMNKVLELGRGTEVNFLYQPASKRGGKQYRTRPITERNETPMSIVITKDGNIVINTISQEKLQRNAVDAIKAGKATLWGNDYQALWADIGTYIRNHQSGEGGAANGVGVEKRDFINALFGQFTSAQRDANPILQDMTDRKARNAGVVQSRRLDRINKVLVLSSEFKPSYADVAKNFSPAKASRTLEGSLGEGKIKFTHYSDAAGLRELDPKHFGKSGVTPRSEMSGLPRSYAYAEGSKLGQDKGLIDKRGNQYTGEIDRGLIYDADKDPLGYRQIINREKADQMLVDAGFKGLFRSGRGGVKQIEFFGKVPVKGEATNPDIRYSPGTHVDNIRSIDSVGNKTATQVDPASIKYAENPVKDSVVLPPRWGFVNREIVGMERSFADVDAVVTRAVERLTATANDDATFAKESARFYEDMADSSMILSDIVSPGVKGGEQANLADLMLRYLALGSPRTDVSGNATKSSGSAASVAGGFQPGYKLGFGSQQVGAKETFAAWQKGEHFNLDMPGIDDKVRSFYINGLSELIEKLQKAGDTGAADALMLRAAKSLHIVAPDHAKLTPAEAKEVQRHLDGKATVDMWDMAGKGYAWPGFILRKNQRNNAAQPFQWSQDKFAKKATMADPAWATVLKDLGHTEPKDLRYQEARALRIDGNVDWSAKTWAERVKQPFPPETPFTYFTQGTEAGLSPGGAGPMYDAQQGMDGLIADRLNELGMAPMFGKEKLKARNAQEILWAQEKLDNPIESNNDLSLYGNTFKQLAATVGELRLGQGLTKRARAEAVLAATDRAYAAMAKQEMPFEVVTSGTSPNAQRIQSKIEALRTAGDPDPVKSLTASVADGLGDTINDLSIKHGLDAFVDEINVRRGGYTEGGRAAISPNIVAILRGKPEDVRAVLDTVSRALDQDGGNIMRKPTVRELNDANVKKANVATFDTRSLGEPQREALFLELSALKDAKGETFMTGFTETSDGIAIGDQFYGGDFVAAMEQNRDAIAGILNRYQVPGVKMDRLVVDTFRRGTAPGKEAASPFAKDLADHLARKVTEAKAPGRQFPQATDTAALLTKGAEAKAAGVGALPKSRQIAVLSQLKSDVDAALLRGQIDEQTAQRIKAAIP